MGNANSGRRPHPTRLKVVRGNPGKRPLNTREPQPAAATDAFDAPPAELAGDVAALVEWARVAPMLRACGLVTEAERSALTALCQQWSRYLEAHGKVMSLGMVVKAANGVPVVNPYLAVADKALAHCLKLWVELGLTPSGRSRMTALPGVEPKQESKWAGLLP